MKRPMLAAAAAASIVLASGAAPARGIVLAQYDVAGANAAISDDVEVAFTAANVTAVEIEAHGDLDPPFDFAGTFMYRGWPSGSFPDASRYYQFSITPQPGFSIDYDSLSFAVGSGGSGTGELQVSASLNGFATPGAVVATRSFAKDAMWHPFDLDLSSLGSHNGTVTFRFTMYRVGGSAVSGLGVNPAFGNQGRNLSINGTVFAGAPPTACVPDLNTLCIDDAPGDRRFRARVAFETTQGSMPAGAGRAIPLNSLGIPSGGIFWFTNSQNPEMLLKVLNGCAFNGHYWVFYAAGTNFALRTEVVDTETGASWVRTNPDRTQAPPFGDIVAFPCGSPSGLEAGGEQPSAAEQLSVLEAWSDPDGFFPETFALEPREACSPNANTLCIDDQPGDARFEATVFFSTTQGGQPSGFGTAIPLASLGVPSGGVFWFTNSQNPEMLLKVLNGCAFNNRYWVFYAAGTNFALDVMVTDTVTGATWRNVNPDRRQAPPIGDINAFPCQGP